MKKILRLFKFKLFWTILVVALLILGFSFYQYKPNVVCPDCNIILISVDTLKPDHMGVYGYVKNTTPNIDKWAKNAFIFANARTMTPTTYPSFAMFMTSKTPFESGIYGNSVGYDGVAAGFVPLSNNAPTLAQILQKNGYTTAAFLNTDSLDPELTNMNRGFSVIKDYPTLPLDGPAKSTKEYKSFIDVNAALNWLDKNKDKKFFLWIHLMEPHSPYFPAKEFYCKFDKRFCDLIKNPQDLQKLENERVKLKGCQPLGLPSDTIDLYKNLYDGAVASADKLIGKVFDKINATKLNEKSIVVFYGDHGEGFDHTYYFFHNHNLYDSFVKIPVIIKVPNLLNFGIRYQSIQNIQILPTLLDLLGIKYNTNQIKTNSFASLFKDDGSYYGQSEYTFLVNDTHTKYAVIKGRYKYIYSLEQSCKYLGQREELYDLVTDHEELNNIIDKNREIAANLKSTLMYHLYPYKLPALELNTATIQLSPTPEKKVIENLKSLGY